MAFVSDFRSGFSIGYPMFTCRGTDLPSIWAANLLKQALWRAREKPLPNLLWKGEEECSMEVKPLSSWIYLADILATLFSDLRTASSIKVYGIVRHNEWAAGWLFNALENPPEFSPTEILRKAQEHSSIEKTQKPKKHWFIVRRRRLPSIGDQKNEVLRPLWPPNSLGGHIWPQMWNLGLKLQILPCLFGLFWTSFELCENEERKKEPTHLY